MDNIAQITDKNGKKLLLVEEDTLLGSLDLQEEMANLWLKSINDVREDIKKRNFQA